MNRAIFLDRDGVLLDHSGLVISGVRAALWRFRLEGFMTIVVTNQPDIATGKMDRVILDRVNDNLRRVLPIDGLYVCPHDDKAKCECRKPKPGMILHAAASHDIDLRGSFMVGDRWRDIGAGKTAGCRTLLVGTGYGEPLKDKPDYRAADMAHAVEIILEGA